MSLSLYTQTRGKGKELVLLHGWGLNSGVWEPMLPLLTQHFRVTCIDLPGFGRNAAVTVSPYQLETVAQLVAAHLPDKSVLLGWSMGGLVAQKIALLHRDKISHLVVLASTPCFCQQQDWPGIRPDVLDMFEQQLEKDFAKTLERFLAIQAMGSETARQDIKQIRHCIQDYPMPAADALQAGLKLLSTVDLRDQLAQIQVPTTRLYGRRDSLVPERARQLISELQPEAVSYTFAHASHAPFISHPEEFVRVLMGLNDQ